MRKPIFWKNVPMSQEIPKRPKTAPKMSFFWFWHKSNKFIYTFVLEYESVNGYLTFSKDRISVKNLVHELWSKNLQTNQNARFFKLELLANKLRHKVKFCMWLDIRKSNKFTHSFQVGMIRNAPNDSKKRVS